MQATKRQKELLKNTKYKVLVEHCEKMGSFPYYTVDQIFEAEKDDAPINAIFKNSTGEWVTK